MTQYLLSMYQPDGVTPPPAALAKVMQDLSALIEEGDRVIAEMESGEAQVYRGDDALIPMSAITR